MEFRAQCKFRILYATLRNTKIIQLNEKSSLQQNFVEPLAPCKVISDSPDSGFHDVDSGSHVLDSRLYLSRFQNPKGLFSGILKSSGSGFRILKSRIPDSKSKCFLDSRIQITLYWAKHLRSNLTDKE